jgi:hypothetical protein
MGGRQMDPNDLIDRIVDALDYAELANDAQGLIQARRLLNNELRQAIDQYVLGEISKAFNQPLSKIEAQVFQQDEMTYR